MREGFCDILADMWEIELANSLKTVLEYELGIHNDFDAFCQCWTRISLHTSVVRRLQRGTSFRAWLQHLQEAINYWGDSYAIDAGSIPSTCAAKRSTSYCFFESSN